ncbi:MAG: hypothetical protein ABEH56_06500 [Salinirussus sp.]
MEPGRVDVRPACVLTALVGLVVLTGTAGCTGLGGPLFDSETTGTVTPVPVPATPTDAAPTRRVSTAQNGTAGGLTPAELIAAHERALRGKSFRIGITERLVVNGSTVRNVTHRWTVSGDRTASIERFRRRASDLGSGSSDVLVSETYVNGSIAATRLRTNASGPSQYSYDRIVRSRRTLAGRVQLRRAFEAFDDEFSGFGGYVAGERGRVFGDNRFGTPALLSTPPGTTHPRDGTFVAVRVDGGLLRTVRVRYTVTVPGNRTGRVVRRIRVSDVGEARVETPRWVRTARERAARSGRG